MGLFSTIFGKKTSNKTDMTTTPVIPDWLQTPIQDAVGKVSELGQSDPSTLVADLNPLQTMAGTTAAGLTGNPQNFADAGAMTRGALFGGGASQAGTASSLPGIGGFMNPFTDSVVNNTLAGFDANAQRQVKQGELNGGHGIIGSNFQVGDALLKGQQGLDRGQLESGIRSQGFDTAAQLADAQANREQQSNNLNAQLGANFQRDNAANTLATAGQLANLTSAQDANTRANAGTMTDVGGTLQSHDQQVLDAPFDLSQFVNSQLSGLPLDMFPGEHKVGTGSTTDTPSALDAAGKAIKMGQTIAALFASDERLKRDIERIGTRPDGLGVYLYRYLWSPIQFIGVMAQEVLKVKPEAVHIDPSGFLMVDYARLEA